jgi:hypothetical protein
VCADFGPEARRFVDMCVGTRRLGYPRGVIPFFRPSLLTIVWLVVGVAVAASQDYFDSLGTVGRVLTAIAAVLLWPLLLFGFDVSISR